MKREHKETSSQIMKSNGDVARETEYIASMLKSLKKLADNSDDKMLHYLIEVAELHANDLLRKKTSKKNKIE